MPATKTAHTPGPWRITDRDDAWEIAPSGCGQSLAEITYTGGNAEANARLIAAAPVLLAALEALVAAHEESCGFHADQQTATHLCADWDMIEQAREAIRLATEG